jgi:hypothetical protein
VEYSSEECRRHNGAEGHVEAEQVEKVVRTHAES